MIFRGQFHSPDNEDEQFVSHWIDGLPPGHVAPDRRPRAPEKKCGEWCDQACKDEGGTQTPAGILIELPRDRVAGRPDEQRSQTHADQVQDQKEEGGRAATDLRSEERRVGKGWVSTCRSRWSPDH